MDSDDDPAPAPITPQDAPDPAPAPAPITPQDAPAPTSQEDAAAPTPPEDAPAPSPLHPQVPFCFPFQNDFELLQWRAAEIAERERQAAEAARQRYLRRRLTRHSSKPYRRAVTETSQSTSVIHGSSEVEDSTIMDTSQQQTLLHEEDGSSSMDTKQHQTLLHEEDLPDWMSQLFEKLDLEASTDDDESIGEVAQAEAHPLVEEGMSEKREQEANRDGIRSLFKVSQVGKLPPVEGVVSSKDWLKLGGYEDDVSSLPEANQEENSIDSDEFYDLIDKEVKDYCKSMKKVSYKETIENGFKWMSEECFLAFTNSDEKLHLKGIEHKFGELNSHCFSVESHDKNFHHYNFSIEEKDGNSDVWTSKLYFAEVKQLSGVKYFLCCLLEPNDWSLLWMQELGHA